MIQRETCACLDDQLVETCWLGRCTRLTRASCEAYTLAFRPE
jgi:hypothetical protein